MKIELELSLTWLFDFKGRLLSQEKSRTTISTSETRRNTKFYVQVLSTSRLEVSDSNEIRIMSRID